MANPLNGAWNKIKFHTELWKWHWIRSCQDFEKIQINLLGIGFEAIL